MTKNRYFREYKAVSLDMAIKLIENGIYSLNHESLFYWSIYKSNKEQANLVLYSSRVTNNHGNFESYSYIPAIEVSELIKDIPDECKKGRIRLQIFKQNTEYYVYAETRTKSDDTVSFRCSNTDENLADALAECMIKLKKEGVVFNTKQKQK